MTGRRWGPGVRQHRLAGAVRHGLAALAALACLAGPADGQAVHGRVLDARTSEPVAGATVEVRSPAGVTATTVSGRSGEFRLRLAAPGLHRLAVRHIGFGDTEIELRVPPEPPVRLELLLEPRAILMDSVTVTADPYSTFLEDVGFGRRMGGGQGVFITRSDIEASGAHRTSELLRGRVGIRFLRAGPGGAPDARFSRGTYHGCAPQLLLNGAMVRRGAAGQRLETTLDALTEPAQIAGIEIYPGPSEIPPEFNGTGSACGVILIWLRP